MSNSFVLMGATACLALALIEAWVILARFTSETGLIARVVPGGRDLVRSHIDYLMMSQFLFVFYGLARVLAVSYPAWIVIALCFGALFNPFGFLVRAIRPAYLEAPPAIFMGIMTTSCVATTLGFLSAAWKVVDVALASP